MRNVFGILISGLIVFSSAVNAEGNDLTDVIFYSGENNGALEIAKKFYDLEDTSKIESSILDIDNNGAAEISVRFIDECDNNKCLTTILFYSEGQWLEIYSENVESIAIQSTEKDVSNIVTSNGVSWEWLDTKFIGRVPDTLRISQFAEAVDFEPKLLSGVVTGNFDNAIQYSIDLDQDGTFEKVLLLDSLESCNAQGRCKGYIFTDLGDYSGTIFHYKDELRVKDTGENTLMITNNPTSSIIYAYEEQSLIVDKVIQPMPVKAR